MSKYKVFWHQSENFGDKLTPWLLDYYGIDYEYTDKGIQEDHYIIAGSILTACNEHSIIWGAGIAQEHEIVKPKKIAAVRGGWTRSSVLEAGHHCLAVYGDIAMLLPIIFPYNPQIEREEGYIPHMISNNKPEGCQDITDSVEDIVHYIKSSKVIRTSSLHAAITAYAFKKEVIWEWCDGVISQNFKWYDYQTTLINGAYNLQRFIDACPIEELQTQLIEDYDEVRSSNN